jgi:hypothetical protein
MARCRSGRQAAGLACVLVLGLIAQPAAAQSEELIVACTAAGETGPAVTNECSGLQPMQGSLVCPAQCATAFITVGQRCINALASDPTTSQAYQMIFAACNVTYTLAANATSPGTAVAVAPALAPLAEMIAAAAPLAGAPPAGGLLSGPPPLALAPATAPAAAPGVAVMPSPAVAVLTPATAPAAAPAAAPAVSPAAAPTAIEPSAAPVDTAALAPSLAAAPAPQAAARNAGSLLALAAAASAALLAPLA